MIRFLEKEQAQSARYAASVASVTSLHSQNSPTKSAKRIPILAISTNPMQEDKRFELLQAGFDGWLVKPIDFRRLENVLLGVGDTKVRREALYSPGEWEKGGGWFLP